MYFVSITINFMVTEFIVKENSCGERIKSKMNIGVTTIIYAKPEKTSVMEEMLSLTSQDHI